MNILLHLILAHFLADYPFQWNWLAKYKQKHPLGILIHSFTHFVVSLILTIPFLYMGKVWLGILFIFVTHTGLDQLKIYLGKNTKWNPFLLYVSDQLAHLLVIWGVVVYWGVLAPLWPGEWLKYYFNDSILSFALILTLVTYFYDVSRWTYLNMRKKQPYKRDYKMMIRNALIVVIAFTVYWIA